ncbi:MAG: hypothetical protein BWY87_00281 [Deltaproteobacteria bacterium ADurb.Bin510]|nr:MAG: hypothetical protein BWY87_00281 [Deltaproteobacteria bacterium ADurb.Bin510]
MRRKLLWLALAFLLVLPACGRKLPPEPPGPQAPVTLGSIRALKDGRTAVRVRVAAPGEVLLLGKARGLCPNCTDDLKTKDSVTAETAGTLTLYDKAPEDPSMVYRAAVRVNGAVYMTEAQIFTQQATLEDFEE